MRDLRGDGDHAAVETRGTLLVDPVVILFCEGYGAGVPNREENPLGRSVLGSGPSPAKRAWRGARGKNSGDGLRVKNSPSPFHVFFSILEQKRPGRTGRSPAASGDLPRFPGNVCPGWSVLRKKCRRRPIKWDVSRK